MEGTVTTTAGRAEMPGPRADVEIFLDMLRAHAVTATGAINAMVHDLPLDIFGQIGENLDDIRVAEHSDRYYLVGKQKFGRFTVTVFSEFFNGNPADLEPDLENQAVADVDNVAAAAGLEVPVRARASNAAPRTGNLEPHPNTWTV